MFQPEHVLSGHLLHPHNNEAVIRDTSDPVWPSLLLIVCLVLLAMVRYRWVTKLGRIMRSVVSRQLQQQLEREEIDPFRFYRIALTTLLLINTSFLLWKLNQLERFLLAGEHSFLQFLFFLVVVCVVYFARSVVNGAVGLITGHQRFISEYSINSALINQSLGIAVLPLVILIEFSKFNPYYFLYAAAALMAVAAVLRWARGLRKALWDEGIGFLQILSYFCALEILPVLVLVKFLVVTF